MISFFSLADNRNLKVENIKKLVLSVFKIRCDSSYFLCFWTCLALYIPVLASSEQKLLFQIFFCPFTRLQICIWNIYLSLKAMVAQLFVQLYILQMHKEPRAIGTHKSSALQLLIKGKDWQMPRSVCHGWLTTPGPSVPWFAANILGRQSSSFHSLNQQATYYFQKQERQESVGLME